MKEKLNIKNRSVLLSVFGLAFLLLLSPCKVKNYIQSELGLPQTEVINENKTTLGNCSTTEISETVLNFSNSASQHLSALAVNNTTLNFNIVDFNNRSSVYFNTKKHSVSLVPYYILYQNFQHYL